MDKKLQQIIKIRPLQDDYIAYRTSTTNLYREMLKTACISETNNLVNVEMAVEQVQLKMPDEQQKPPIQAEIKKSKVDCLLKECFAVEEGLHLLP